MTSTELRATTGDTLDCGHILTDAMRHSLGTHSTGVPFGTGYARDAKTDATMCYPCAETAERASFLVAGMTGEPFTAYVSSSGDLTTWTGAVLAHGIRYAHGVSRSGWHGSEIHSWRFRYTEGSFTRDATSAEWYGRNAGPGMVITVRRAKNISS